MRYNIPKITIHDKIKALNRGEVTMQPKLGRFTNTFSAEYEQVLVDHIKDLSNRCMPLMKKEFLKLAYDLAEVMKIPHRKILYWKPTRSVSRRRGFESRYFQIFIRFLNKYFSFLSVE